MERSRSHRPANTGWVVLGRKATNSASQVRKSRSGPNTSAMAWQAYHSSWLP